MPNPTEMIDLRSDTVTRPDAGMYAAMTSAPLGDDVFGDDPTVLALEAKAAEVCGKEAAVFVPTGTMGNSLALGTHCRPGDEVILERLCHTFNYEQAGAARLWGVQSVPFEGDRGRISTEAVRGAVRADDPHLPRTRLVVLEQTSNIAGGCVLPLEYLREVGALCRELDLRFHIDGARVFNASVASGVGVREFAACADSMMFCFSKGLGAPAGSMLVGGADFIREAHRLRKLLGGGMRQSGVVAACGLYALDHNVERLADDHRRAKDLGARLGALVDEWGTSRGFEVTEPETNMVFVRWRGDDPSRYGIATEALADAGVHAVGLPERGIRFVFHKDVDESSAERASEIILETLSRVLEA